MPVSSRRKRSQVGAKVSFEVNELEKDEARRLVIQNHYSGRCPGIKYCFGLYESGRLVGCVVYAIPASYTLCNGVCGEEYRAHVIELARLVVTTGSPNAASFLIGQSLSVLPEHVVVSYADCNSLVGHVGYVYQATNWIYTGQGNAEPIWVETSTGRVVSYTRRHIDQKARKLGYAWDEGASSGPGLHKTPGVGKHRYVYITGNKKFKRAARAALKYRVYPYPKGETRRHAGNVMQVEEREVLPTVDKTPPPPKKLRG